MKLEAADCGHEAELATLTARVAELETCLRAEKKMVHALDASPRVCAVADPDNGFGLCYLNAAAERLLDRLGPALHVPRDRVLGSRIDEVFGMAEFAPNIVGVARNLPVTGTYQIGSEWLDLYISPITAPSGNLIGLLLAASVVTERQQASQSVAAESEEMSASIREIARNAQNAATTAAEAASSAQRADETVTALAQSGAEISGVVTLISHIASQTRLLALNATIEAARVGDAGRGFAVVAGEVKQLAQETADAIEGIRSRVEAIQLGSREAVTIIRRIREVVDDIDQAQAAIASAVEEQTATTAELSRHLVAGAR